MKFRIIRYYEEFQPQVWHKNGQYGEWITIGETTYATVEGARKVCEHFKAMREDPLVEEFEL